MRDVVRIPVKHGLSVGFVPRPGAVQILVMRGYISGFAWMLGAGLDLLAEWVGVDFAAKPVFGLALQQVIEVVVGSALILVFGLDLAVTA